MPIGLSSRSRVSPFLVMDVMEEARLLEDQGRHIVHMEVGQPGTPAPRAAIERLAAATGQGEALGYTVALGLPALREGIAALYQRRHGIELDPERVVVTAGSSCAFILSFIALFDQGARVALADPGYPAYRNIMSALGIEPVRIETTLATGYQPTTEQLAEAGPLDGLLVASPANPTGTMLERAALSGLASWCTEAGVSFISDEIYHGLTYDQDAVSALEMSGDAIVINSFAKYFSMTGWRIGWMVVPPEMVRTVEALSQNLFICPSHASQVAAIGALDAGDELEGHRTVYAANRRHLMEALPDLGFRNIAPADGAFYIYADVPEWGGESPAFCKRLLDEAGVATTTGLDFDPVRGKQTLRLSFAQPESEILEGIRRLRAFAEGQ